MTAEQAPYDRDGNLLHYPQHYGGIEWRLNEPFTARMMLTKVERGRSAAYFIWIDQENHTYPMFMTDMLDFLKRSELSEGITYPDARWIVRKRGRNFGLAMAP